MRSILEHRRRAIAVINLLITSVAIPACGDDDGAGPTLQSATVYDGVFSDQMNVGVIRLTFASPVASVVPDGVSANLSAAATPPVSATGQFRITGGATINLTGSVNEKALTMSGSGYSLTGTLENGQITGNVQWCKRRRRV